MSKQQRVLVLGANGFIGSHLVDRLIEYGYPVRAFGRFENEPLFKHPERVEIFKGDFLNQNDIEEALEGVSYLVHLISTTTPATSDKDPLIDLTTNVAGSIALFQKCLINGNIKRIVFASSGGTVYGDNYPGRPFAETDLTNPISPYGIGKLTIENYLHYYNRIHGQKYTVFRISNPYGGRQKTTKQQGIMPILIKNIAEGLPITIYGDGTMVRDYFYIYDLVDVITQSLAKDLRYNTYNIGSAKGISLNELVEIVENVTGNKAIIERRESPATFVQTSILDNTRMVNEIPINFTSIRDGVQAMYSSYLDQLNQ